MKGCNCGTVHKDAHAPGCSGFAVEADALRRDNARLREALELIADGEGNPDQIARNALKETRP